MKDNSDLKYEGIENVELPPDFLFGVANSAFQAEGGFNRGDGPRNNFAEWERIGKVEPSGDSVRFWDNYEDHIKLAASLGLNAFRMGFSWSRVQPTISEWQGPPPSWDEKALDRYAKIVEMIINTGMEPIITLHHFTHPAWLPKDFWLNDDMVHLFVDYTVRAVGEINLRLIRAGKKPINFIITFNEPNILPLNSYMIGELPHGKRGFAAAKKAWDNLLYTHILVYDALYDIYEREGWGRPFVGFNTFCFSIYEFDKICYDLIRAPSLGVGKAELKEYFHARRADFNQRFMQMAAHRWGQYSNQTLYYRNYRGVCSWLFEPGLFKRTVEALYASPRKKKLDYLALDIYDPFVAGGFYFRFPTPQRLKNFEPIFRPPWWEWYHDPFLFGEMIKVHNHRNDTSLPIYVMENGIGYRQKKFGMASPRRDGLTKDKYLRWSIGETMKALRESVPVKGYIYWTLVDNYEWGSYEVRLGLHDYDHIAGKIKDTDGLGLPAGKVYAEIVNALRKGENERIRKVFAL